MQNHNRGHESKFAEKVGLQHEKMAVLRQIFRGQKRCCGGFATAFRFQESKRVVSSKIAPHKQRKSFSAE